MRQLLPPPDNGLRAGSLRSPGRCEPKLITRFTCKLFIDGAAKKIRWMAWRGTRPVRYRFVAAGASQPTLVGTSATTLDVRKRSDRAVRPHGRLGIVATSWRACQFGEALKANRALKFKIVEAGRSDLIKAIRHPALKGVILALRSPWDEGALDRFAEAVLPAFAAA
ncbi:MAG: hypothetical protein R2702_06750 [Acidimicrobiales bacterium]